MSSRKQAGAIVFGLSIKRIYSGSCCAIAYLSGSPLREENEENAGRCLFFIFLKYSQVCVCFFMYQVSR